MTLARTNMFFIISIYLLLCSLSSAEDHKIKCPCSDTNNCKAVSDWNANKSEVIVVTDQSKDFTLWKTDAFTSVIEWNDHGNNDAMCYAHSQGKKYGFYLDTIPVKYNSSNSNVTSFINTTREDIRMQFADILALGLIDLLGDCDNAGHHVAGIIDVTTTVINGLKNGTNLRVLCVMPWKPPCFDSNCDINPALAKVCDGLIISPESYNTYCWDSCTAKATMGYGKVMYGMTEYLASGWSTSQVLLGIPWHGYNYTCVNDGNIKKMGDHYLCPLKTTKIGDTSVTKCDLEGSRRKISLGAPVSTSKGKVSELGLLSANMSKADMSPWTLDIVKDVNKTTTYMTWYENIPSLIRKYEIVHEHELKGAVIFTADDLTYTHLSASEQYNDNMWAWTLHTILSTSIPVKRNSKLNTSGMMAGIGVGMFVLGCLLGVIFSCIAFRRKKGLRPPFSRDPLAEEFRDDDDHNQL